LDSTSGVGRNRPAVLWLVPLITLAMLQVWLSTSRYGIGISADSVGYISVAHSLLAGQGFRCFDGRPYVDQPPGFPLLLAGCGLLGLAPVQAARLVNALALGAIVGMAGMSLRRLITCRRIAALGAWAVTVSVPLNGVGHYAWTEPLFILCALLFCDRMTRFITADDRRAFAAAALCAALACLLRYIGLTIVLTGAIALLWVNSGENVGRRCRDAALFVGLAVMPLAAWCLRNWLISATLFGARIPSTFTWKQILMLTAETIVRWLAIPGVSSGLRIGPLGVTLLAVVGFGLYRVAVGKLDPSTRVSLRLTACFTLVYLAWLMVSSATVAFDRIGDRLLSPVFVPLAMLTVFAIDQWRTIAVCPGAGKRLTTTGLVGLSLWLAFPTCAALRRTRSMAVVGAGGYSTARWHESPLVRSLRRQPLPGPVYSNRPDALYLLTGIATRLSPQKSYHNNFVRRNLVSLPQFQRELEAAGTASLVWFPDSPRRYLYTVDELPSSLGITRMATFPDGTIYTLRGRQRPRKL
jgi:hypothetical protein